MVFVNERTYQNYLEEGREDEFHREYEKALEKIELGKEYPLLIGKEEIKINDKMIVKSPVDTSIVVGIFQRDNGNNLANAINIANEGFKF